MQKTSRMFKKYQAQNLIKLTGDNPFIDINLIKEGFDIFNNLKKYRYSLRM